MKALITGSGGFIGKHLSDRLNAQGFQVIGLKRELFSDFNLLNESMQEIKPDYIFHLAAYGNHSTQTDEDMTFSANVIYTYLLLRATANLKYKAFINFGSSSEYGKKATSMHEDDILEPITLYGATKGASTLIARYFALKYNKPIATVRPFSVYGEGEADFRFIPTVIRSLNNGTVMDLAGEPKHDWIYIQDFLDGVSTVVNRIEQVKGEAVNIGTGVQYSNFDVVKELERISGKNLKLDVFGDKMARPYDTTNWVANINTLKSFGWKPRFTLSSGLKRVYDYQSQPKTKNT